MEQLIKLLTHIRASLASLQNYLTGSFPVNTGRFRTWLLDNSFRTISVGKSMVVHFEMHNPNDVPVYVRLYDVLNPDVSVDLPAYSFLVPAKGSLFTPLPNKNVYTFDEYITIHATTSYETTLNIAASSTIYVDLRFILPHLPNGGAILTDPEGNYLIDAQGNYLIIQT
jgi:hypothetical protein